MARLYRGFDVEGIAKLCVEQGRGSIPAAGMPPVRQTREGSEQPYSLAVSRVGVGCQCVECLEEELTVIRVAEVAAQRLGRPHVESLCKAYPEPDGTVYLPSWVDFA